MQSSSNAPNVASYCLKVSCEEFPDLRFVFKAAPGEVRAVDPDLQMPYDIEYETGSDACELRSRLFTRDEATDARERLLNACGSEKGWRSAPKWDIDIKVVDSQAPLDAFPLESRLLRLLPWWKTEGASFDDLSFAWSSSRLDGARATPGRLLYRRTKQSPQLCFEVSARRTTLESEANVYVRFGRPFDDFRQPGGPAERFGAIEWSCPFLDLLTDDAMLSASRALTQKQADVLADVLRSDPNFSDVRVVAHTLAEFSASEGMLSWQSVRFAEATEQSAAAVGFDFFLSVWPDEQ